MSFKVGQFRSSANSTYIVNETFQNINQKPFEITNKISAGADISFKDKAIAYNFTAGQNYYIKIKILRRKDSDQTITLRLAHTSDSTIDTYQFVDSYTIFTATEEEQYAVIESIVQPNSAYQQLNLILSRTSADFQISNQDSNNANAIGRTIRITDYEIYQLSNLIDKKCTKIGVQGPPNMLMCINGEEIRIGPSGIYEIKNGYIINFIGVVPRISRDSTGAIGRDNFLIDYQYEEK